MAANIKITYQQVQDKTRQMRDENERLTNYLGQIRRAIEALESEWTSDTSDTIRSKITGMQPKFDSYQQVIESYCAFLDKTVENYTATESTLQTNAASKFE